MRSKLALVAACLCIVMFSFVAASPAAGSKKAVPLLSLEGGFVPNEILIGLKPEAAQLVARQRLDGGQIGVGSLDRLNQKYAVKNISSLFPSLDLNDSAANKHGMAGVYKLTVPDGTDVYSMIAEFQRDAAIAYAEPNRIYQALDFPNDTDFGKQWGLHNTGQTGGTVDADVDMPEAWDIEKGNPSVLIAIVDTGVDYTHSDLAGGRIRTDIDHDFSNSDDDAMDDHGHGTFVAGIAAGDTNNNLGIAGVCQGCQILPVKVLNSEGKGTAETVSQGIQYAANAGAKIINMSLGFASNCGCSQTVARTINYAFDRGSLLIAASGNDSDKQRTSYPGSSPRVLGVGAYDHNAQEADFSNRDVYLDILAPGKDIYGLDLHNAYRTASGTSAATPHASGVAGLLWSARPGLSNIEVWWILHQSAEDLSGVGNSVSGPFPTASSSPQALDFAFSQFLPAVSKMRSTFGRLNAYRALTMTTSGQMFASEDTCSSEPSCPPGCGAEVTLAGQSNAAEDLQLLRNFRDRTLARSSTGQRLTTLYERHRLEVALLIATDERLRNQTRLTLKQWLPLFKALTYDDAEGPVLTREHVAAAYGVIDELIAKGSPKLRQDLENARRAWDLNPLIGMDARAMWSKLSEQQ